MSRANPSMSEPPGGAVCSSVSFIESPFVAVAARVVQSRYHSAGSVAVPV
jgi:hypothetical protein